MRRRKADRLPQNERCVNHLHVADQGRFRHSDDVAYPLTFTQEFFWNDEHDAVSPHKPKTRPTSVEQAVSQLSNETWSTIAREVFHCEPEYLNIETVLKKIVETNTCLNLDPPVEVYIDADGEFMVLVYDREN